MPMKNIVISLILICLTSLLGIAQQDCKLLIGGTINQVSCSGGMDGAVRIQVSGGTLPYAYYWSNGEELKDITQLTEGMYIVTVRDADGCVGKAEFKVEAERSGALNLNIEQQPTGNRKSILKVAFENGQEPYAVNIKNTSDGIRAPHIKYTGQALNAGIYSLEAFTEAGCSVMARVVINAK